MFPLSRADIWQTPRSSLELPRSKFDKILHKIWMLSNFAHEFYDFAHGPANLRGNIGPMFIHSLCIVFHFISFNFRKGAASTWLGRWVVLRSWWQPETDNSWQAMPKSDMLGDSHIWLQSLYGS